MPPPKDYVIRYFIQALIQALINHLFFRFWRAAGLFLFRSFIMAAVIGANELTEGTEHARADETVTNETCASDEKFKEPGSEEPTIDENSEEFEGIPLVVREIVSFKDDPTELTLTFR